MKAQIDVTVEADYGQFYVRARDGGPGTPADVSATMTEALQAGVGTSADGKSLVILCVKKAGPVAVRVQSLSGPPPAPGGDVDHSIEVSLDLSSEGVAVESWDSEGPSGTLAVLPGWYRVRVDWRGIAEIPDDAPEGENDTESYLIQLWPAPRRAAAVLRLSPRMSVVRECEEDR